MARFCYYWLITSTPASLLANADTNPFQPYYPTGNNGLNNVNNNNANYNPRYTGTGGGFSGGANGGFGIGVGGGISANNNGGGGGFSGGISGNFNGGGGISGGLGGGFGGHFDGGFNGNNNGGIQYAPIGNYPPIVKPNTYNPYTQVGSNGQNTPMQYTIMAKEILSGRVRLYATELTGFMILENWITSDQPLWQGAPQDALKDERALTKYLKSRGENDLRKIDEFRANWYTYDDLMQMKLVGINAVRIPIGFWLLQENNGDFRTAVAFLDYFINVLCASANMAVVLVLAAHEGCQNTRIATNCPNETINWSEKDNVDKSIAFAQAIHNRYKGSDQYAGMEPNYEPSRPVKTEDLARYYKAVIDMMQNQFIVVVAPIVQDIERCNDDWAPFFRSLSSTENVYLGITLYVRWLDITTHQQMLDLFKSRQTVLQNWTVSKTMITGFYAGAPDNLYTKGEANYFEFIDQFKIVGGSADSLSLGTWKTSRDNGGRTFDFASARSYFGEKILQII